MKKIRNLLISYLVLIFYKLFKNTPYKLNVVIGRIIGSIFYHFDFRYKYLTYKNISYIFPKYNYKQILKLSKNCYKNLGQNLMEFFLLERVKFIYKKLVDFPQEDKEILLNLYNNGKGVIIFSAHFSNWELLGCCLAVEKFPISVVARKFYISSINAIIEKIRTSVGEIIIGRGGQSSIKLLIKSLKNKNLIGVLIDQNIKNVKNINVEFLGKISPTPVSFIEMAVKYNIPSVVGLIIREKSKYKVRIIPIDSSYYNDPIEFTRYINSIISDYIYKYPEQWTWVHNRWSLV